MTDVTYAEQLKALFEEITKDTGYQIVLGLQAHDKPKDDATGETKYPFIGYNLMTQRRVANISYTKNNGDNVDMWWEEQYEFTISFVVCSKSPYESIEVAKELFEWLSIKGQDFMTRKQIVHISSTPITNRDFFLINDYERRNGFDCRLRLGRRVDNIVPRIKAVEIQHVEVN